MVRRKGAARQPASGLTRPAGRGTAPRERGSPHAGGPARNRITPDMADSFRRRGDSAMSEANSHFIQLPDAGVQLSIINNLVLRRVFSPYLGFF